MVRGGKSGVDRRREIKNLILDVLRKVFVVEPKRWHLDFKVCVVNQRAGGGVRGGGVGTGSHRGPRVSRSGLRRKSNGGRYPLAGGGGASMRLDFEARGLELKRSKCL